MKRTSEIFSVNTTTICILPVSWKFFEWRMDQVYSKRIACTNGSAARWACAGKGQDRVGKGIAEGTHDYA